MAIVRQIGNTDLYSVHHLGVDKDEYIAFNDANSLIINATTDFSILFIRQPSPDEAAELKIGVLQEKIGEFQFNHKKFKSIIEPLVDDLNFVVAIEYDIPEEITVRLIAIIDSVGNGYSDADTLQKLIIYLNDGYLRIETDSSSNNIFTRKSFAQYRNAYHQIVDLCQPIITYFQNL